MRHVLIVLGFALTISGCASGPPIRLPDGQPNDEAIGPMVVKATLPMLPKTTDVVCMVLYDARKKWPEASQPWTDQQVLSLDPRMRPDDKSCTPIITPTPQRIPLTYSVGLDDTWRSGNYKKSRVPADVARRLSEWLDRGYLLTSVDLGYCGGKDYLYAIRQGFRGPEIVDTVVTDGTWCAI